MRPTVSRHALRVWQRDADVFLTTWLVSFIPPMLEPVLYVAAFGLGLGGLIGTVPYQGRVIPYLDFMAPGVIAVAIMFWAFFETTYNSFVRMYYQRTFDAMIATPLLVEDVIIGEWLWGATKSVMASVIMLAMLTLLGLVHWPSASLVVPTALLGGLLFSALGLIATALVPTIDGFNVTTFVIIFPMFLFSGTFFPVEILPDWARLVATGLPLTHVSFLVRGACLGDAPRAWGASVTYLVALTAVASVVAVALMRRRLIK